MTMERSKTNRTVQNLVRHPKNGVVTPLRLWLAWQIADNWRVQKRLPRLTAFGKRVGLIRQNADRESRDLPRTSPRSCSQSGPTKED